MWVEHSVYAMDKTLVELRAVGNSAWLVYGTADQLEVLVAAL